MFSVIVAPADLAPEKYTPIPPVETIHPFRLLVVEEKLEALLKQGCQLLGRVIKHMCIIGEANVRDRLHEKTSQFSWNPKDEQMKDFSSLTDYIEKVLCDLHKRLALVLNIDNCRRVENAAEVGKIMVEKEEFMFIECLYFLVDMAERKKIERQVNKQTATFVRIIDGKGLYKVFCMKNEVEAVQRWIKECAGERNVDFISAELPKMSLLNSPGVKAQENELCSEETEGLLAEAIEVVLLCAIYRGFAEALNKYGLPPNFKFKVIEEDKVKIESRVFKTERTEIEDAIAIVKISVS